MAARPPQAIWDDPPAMSRDTSPPPDQEPAHDVLAAEAFAVPAPDPDLRRPVALPEDPSGIAEPHDILAAEEFAMPAARGAVEGGAASGGGPEGGRGVRMAAAAGGGLLALLGFRRARRRRGS